MEAFTSKYAIAGLPLQISLSMSVPCLSACVSLLVIEAATHFPYSMYKGFIIHRNNKNLERAFLPHLIIKRYCFWTVMWSINDIVLTDEETSSHVNTRHLHRLLTGVVALPCSLV